MSNPLGYNAEDFQMMRMAQEATIARGTKIEEIRLFAKNAGMKKIGIANCACVAREAEAVAEALREDFEVMVVGCKVGKVLYADLFQDDTKGVACNPVGQAKQLGEWGSELNIVMGLCLGHDLLFQKHSTAPSTTLVVKDRANKHNPMASIKQIQESQKESEAEGL